MSLRHVLSAGLLPCALLASGGNAIAQTREDSAAIARLIVTRAVQDAQRQHKRVRTLAWVSTLRSSRDTAVQMGFTDFIVVIVVGVGVVVSVIATL